MSAAKSLDSKIISYLSVLTDKQKKTVLAVVKTFAEDQEYYDPWEDPAFVAEIERRSEELKSGKVKGYSLEEVKQYLRRKAKEQKARAKKTKVKKK